MSSAITNQTRSRRKQGRRLEVEKAIKPRKDVPKSGGQRAIGADNHGKICRRFCFAAFILRLRPFYCGIVVY